MVARLFPQGRLPLIISYYICRHSHQEPSFSQVTLLKCMHMISLTSGACNSGADPSLLPPERSYRIVGTAAVTFAEEEDPRDKAGLPQLPSDAAHVASIAVDQKVRQQGVAGLLLAACEEHARACGFKAISLVRGHSIDKLQQLRSMHLPVKQRLIICSRAEEALWWAAGCAQWQCSCASAVCEAWL